MWVFGYGSLMWDNWCEDLGCRRRTVGLLRGFRRVFNKASTLNWGTKAHPAPTLNLLKLPRSSCKGILFEFPEERRDDVMAQLENREGRGFEFQEVPVRLCVSSKVTATVAIYAGKNILPEMTLGRLAEMASKAAGKNGSGVDYVLNLDDKMRAIGIGDPVVSKFAACLRATTLPKN
jgi:cation transport protein ChaC